MIKLYVFLIVLLSVGSIILICIIRQRNRLLMQSFNQIEKLSLYNELESDWLASILSGERLAEWIKDNGYKTVAIYGMGAVGKLLLADIRTDESISVLYGIDRNKNIKVSGLEIYTLNDNVKPVDLVIVTVIQQYDMVKEEINEKIGFNCGVMPLTELIEKMHICKNKE